MRTINKIIVHHSESLGGDIDFLRYCHVHDNGWRDVGYHYVICNGKPHGDWKAGRDGEIQEGRPIEEAGAHARGYNKDSIGICLIGNLDKTRPTLAQILSLLQLCSMLAKKYGLNPFTDIIGHRDVNQTECPGHNLYSILFLIKNFTAAVNSYAK
jgi:N-acetylmuramoyl-L-alanine amidase